MIYAAILAGGIGSRMGADMPKQFLEFAGKPVIAHTVQQFLNSDDIDRILILTPKEWCSYTEDLLSKYLGNSAKVISESACKSLAALPVVSSCQKAGIPVLDVSSEPMDSCADLDRSGHASVDSVPAKEIIVAAGGATRNETLMNAIRVIEECGDLDDDTIIVTHDAVRPFVSGRMIRENIEAVLKTGACETAFPATDTIIETDDGRLVAAVPDRSRLWMTQTPQSFRAAHLRELYQSLTDEEKEILTDAARIYVMKGEAVEIVRGEAFNIKITYPHDLEVASAIVKTIEAQAK